MGNMRKEKIIGEVAVMEVSSSQQSTIGVRTRARTLALQRLQSSSKPSSDSSSSSYLELRSRRLEKPNSLRENPNPSPRSKGAKPKKEEVDEVEVSFGENVLEFEAWDRNIRETTPCSLIRDSETIGTPGSTTRRTDSSGNNRRIQSSRHHGIPTSHEMEEFFTCAERLQQRIFSEKYNFDPVNDCPLQGRYEWVKVE